MEYKNQTENRAFQEMLQAAVKRLQNRSGEDLAAKSGAVFHSSRNVLEVLSFYETIEIQLPEFRINSNMDEWHYLTLLHYLDMADGTEGSQKLITFGNLKDNWDMHEHFITEDSQGEIDFGENQKNMYALESAEVLVEKGKRVCLAVNEFGKGRAVYMSGLPYSFENSRLLYQIGRASCRERV